MSSTPSISIILPIKNGAIFVEECKASLVENCDSGDEILVVDDHSTDGTLQYLIDWAKQDSRVRVISNPKQGLVNALNLALREATNDWVARVDVDDLYASTRIMRQKEQIINGVVAIFSDYEFFSSKRNDLGTIPGAVFGSAVAVSLISSQRTPHPSVMFNRKAAISVGGYRNEDFPAEDLSLWLRLSRAGKLVSIPETLLQYRISSSSVSANFRANMNEKKSTLLREIRIQPSNFFEVRDFWPQLFAAYEVMSFGVQRKILLCRDLKMNSAITNERVFSPKDFSQMVYQILRTNGSLSALMELKIEQRKRDATRRSL